MVAWEIMEVNRYNALGRVLHNAVAFVTHCPYVMGHSVMCYDVIPPITRRLNHECYFGYVIYVLVPMQAKGQPWVSFLRAVYLGAH